MNYAFVNFETEDDQVAASATHHSYKGQPLFWVPTDTQTCNVCGSPDHYAKSCTAKSNKRAQQQKHQKLYDRFKPAQYRKPKSFADAVKKGSQNTQQNQRRHNNNQQQQNRTNNNNNNNNNRNLQNGTRKGGSMHDPVHSQQLAKIQQSLKEAMDFFKQLKNDFDILNAKVDVRIQSRSGKGKDKESQVISDANSSSKSNISKRNHDEVDPSSADTSSNESDDKIVKDVSSMQSSIGRFEGILNRIAEAVGYTNSLPSESLGGEDLEEEDDNDVTFEDADQDQNEDINFI